jgi:hypothetical protein
MEADYTAEIDIEMKSADMSVFLRSAPIQIRDVIAGVAAAATILAVFLALFAGAMMITLAVESQGVIAGAAGLGIASWPIAGVVFRWVRDRFAWLAPFIPTKFFNLQKECSSIDGLWSSLREQSRGLMAAG